jgi:UDP-N-acetylglucosamine 4,6-dehydratase
MLNGATVLVTGGTGSFGSAFVRRVLEQHKPKAVRIFSRSEEKQRKLELELDDARTRFRIGDVRDRERLVLATRGVDIVIHAAAMKQIPTCEREPNECHATNVAGTQNVIHAAIVNGVPRTIGLSTDKACAATNLYGSSKAMAERLLVQSNGYDDTARFSVTRWGNVIGSTGSVIPVFREQASRDNELQITDDAMTRFWISLDQAVDFTLDSLERMEGGEIFIPKMPSIRIVDLAHAVVPGVPHKIVGIRPGEKIAETLVTKDEARYCRAFPDHYSIRPASHDWPAEYPEGEELPPGFAYMSNTNTDMLVAEDLVAA